MPPARNSLGEIPILAIYICIFPPSHSPFPNFHPPEQLVHAHVAAPASPSQISTHYFKAEH